MMENYLLFGDRCVSCEHEFIFITDFFDVFCPDDRNWNLDYRLDVSSIRWNPSFGNFVCLRTYAASNINNIGCYAFSYDAFSQIKTQRRKFRQILFIDCVFVFRIYCFSVCCVN